MRQLARTLWLLLPLAGCMGAAEETLLDELRIVSLRADPPIIDVLAGSEVTATVFALPETTVDVALWTCTPGGSGCIEAGAGEAALPIGQWATVGPLVEEDVTLFIDPPDLLADVVATEEIPAPVWALACERGQCPVLDSALSDPAPGSDEWQTVVDAFADPFELLETLPIQGTAASFRLFTLGAFPEGSEVPGNPVVTLEEELPLSIESGGRLELRFTVEAAAATEVFPMATAGGFTAFSTPVGEDGVTVELVAGDVESEAGAVDVGTVIELYIAFESEDGGSTLWRGSAEVQ